MADRFYNPFQGIDVSVPVEFRDAFQMYCQRTGGKTIIDQSPFPRMVDFWFVAVCVAARLGLEPADLGKYETYKIIEGSIFRSDPWIVNTLMMIAVSKTEEIEIVSEPRRMMSIANGLAVSGLPKVIEMLKEGDAEPIWNLSDGIEELLRSKEHS